MALTIRGFLGANKALDPKLLPDSVGVESVNQRPGKGDFRPWREPLQVATVPASPQRRTIWRMGQDVADDGQYWLSWPGVVHAIRGFDPEDPTERTYYSGDGAPKWTDNTMALASAPYPTAARELGVPAPATGLVAAIDSEPPGTETRETWYYVHTFVNDLGWESAPSPMSNGVAGRPGSSVLLTNLEAPPAGNYGITRRRIYKTKTGTGSAAEFYLRDEIPVGQPSYLDDGSDLGSDVLPTGGMGAGSSWLPPPADGHGLTAMWGGMASILSGKSARICEPYALYAYPLRYEIALDYKAVAQAVYRQRLLILTTGFPVLVEGSEPAALEAVPIKFNQPCVSPRSVVAFEDGIAWASPNGMCWFGDDGPRVLTAGLLDRRTNPDNPAGTSWEAMNPASMIASRHQGLLFVFYDGGSGARGFVIDPRQPEGIYFLGQGYDAVYRDPVSDELYVLDGGDIKKFDAGAALMTAVFRSKLLYQPQPVSFSCMEVVASAFPVTVRVWADSLLCFDGEVADKEPVRLQASNLADAWQVEVQSSVGAVQAVRLGLDMDDLRAP